MELKRIIARDGRSATEKAIALYGADVLIVANHPLDGQTELIVAVDIACDSSADDSRPGPHTDLPSALTVSSPSQVQAPAGIDTQAFRAFDEAMQLVRSAAPEVARSVALRSTEPPLGSPAQPAIPAPLPVQDPETRALETLRGREIVDMVRQELAALRQEFKLSRQLSSWQTGLEMPTALSPLSEALQEMAVPAGLRALLLESIRSCDNTGQALSAMNALLCAALPASTVSAPLKGIHALCGPSGSGKTLMLARLASAACSQLAPEQITLISFNDARPGAWSQLQMLAAQTGVECLRARDAATLSLMLEELQTRTLVLIDTAGVDCLAQAASLSALQQPVTLHGVLPVDASITSVRRLLQAPKQTWASLMLTKLDEAGHPWPLIQGLSEQPLPISVMGSGERSSQGLQNFDAQQLVRLALAPLHERASAETALAADTEAQAQAESIPTPAPAAKVARPRTRTRTQKVQHG
jgi:flagellar biosynthesis protein FlhF